MTAQEDLNYQLYAVTRRPALPLALKKDAEAAAQEARELLAQGADANHCPKDENGWSVLDGAISSGNADIVQALVDHGAKITEHTVALVGITAKRVQENYDNAPADLKDIFKQEVDAREKIAALILEEAGKKNSPGKKCQGPAFKRNKP